uniref:C2H2-type domain-containing protein n=1 Tax=Trichogramma kaykai TaxID=54128 RepID=A0ABD2X4N5_9HYME
MVHEKRKEYTHHKTVHEGQKDYVCDVCPKMFTTKHNLTRHRKSSHEGQKDYLCDASSHQGKKDHLCDVCPKAFTSKQNLTLHVRLIHEGRKDHICDVCQKAFGTNDIPKLITSCNLGCRILNRYRFINDTIRYESAKSLSL